LTVGSNPTLSAERKCMKKVSGKSEEELKAIEKRLNALIKEKSFQAEKIAYYAIALIGTTKNMSDILGNYEDTEEESASLSKELTEFNSFMQIFWDTNRKREELDQEIYDKMHYILAEAKRKNSFLIKELRKIEGSMEEEAEKFISKEEIPLP
jgi:hypothetical protein